MEEKQVTDSLDHSLACLDIKSIIVVNIKSVMALYFLNMSYLKIIQLLLY